MKGARAAFAAAVFAAACALLPGAARAAAEFCPAQLIPQTQSTASTSFSYQLAAFTPRSVDAALIADTDGGWFAWNVSGAVLKFVKLKRTAHGITYAIPIAISAPFAVKFPSSVTVRHAWVTGASTLGEAFFGWDSQGTVQCQVPAFDDADANDPLGLDNAALAWAPPQETASASAASAPFAPAACPHPFAPPAALAALSPEFPIGVRSWFTGTAAAALSVAVATDGSVLDSWVLAGTGVPDLDKASLLAANRSKYTSGVSYCRPAQGYYLFFTTFTASS